MDVKLAKPGEKAIIHFLFESPAGKIVGHRQYRDGDMTGLGEEIRYAPACHPDRGMPQFASGEPKAVTCEACKQTQAFKDAEVGAAGEWGDEREQHELALEANQQAAEQQVPEADPAKAAPDAAAKSDEPVESEPSRRKKRDAETESKTETVHES